MASSTPIPLETGPAWATEPGRYDSLRLTNFTVFRKAEFNFCPGINVLVGGNGTGKTHALKALYAHQISLRERNTVLDAAVLHIALAQAFLPERTDCLISNGSQERAELDATWNGRRDAYQLASGPGGFIVLAHHSDSTPESGLPTPPIYIPPGDILGHSVGFRSLYHSRLVDYERMYDDLLSFAYLPPLRNPDNRGILATIEKQLGGRVEIEQERFYIISDNGDRLELHMAAEGWRKLALLYLLVANGSIGQGTVLYWDEPETNLNPSVMDEAVHVLLALARRGTQVFIATHSYIILKEIDLQRLPSDAIRHFAMSKDTRAGVVPHPANSYAELEPNLIAAQFDRLYDLEIDRALGPRS